VHRPARPARIAQIEARIALHRAAVTREREPRHLEYGRLESHVGLHVAHVEPLLHEPRDSHVTLAARVGQERRARRGRLQVGEIEPRERSSNATSAGGVVDGAAMSASGFVTRPSSAIEDVPARSDKPSTRATSSANASRPSMRSSGLGSAGEANRTFASRASPASTSVLMSATRPWPCISTTVRPRASRRAARRAARARRDRDRHEGRTPRADPRTTTPRATP
jgi:hypothetical protein